MPISSRQRSRGVADLAAGVEHADRRGRNTGRGKLALNFRPEWKFVGGAIAAAGRFIGRVHGGEPDDFIAGAAGDFERDRIQAAHAVIQRDRSVSGDARARFGDHFGALVGGRVVRLQHEAFQLVRKKFLGEIEIVNAPRDYIRRDVDLNVVAAFDCLPGGV